MKIEVKNKSEIKIERKRQRRGKYPFSGLGVGEVAIISTKDLDDAQLKRIVAATQQAKYREPEKEFDRYYCDIMDEECYVVERIK